MQNNVFSNTNNAFYLSAPFKSPKDTSQNQLIQEKTSKNQQMCTGVNPEGEHSRGYTEGPVAIVGQLELPLTSL